MDTQDMLSLPLNNAQIALITTKGTGTISGMSSKKSKHKKTKSVSGPEIFNIPNDDSKPTHRRTRSSRAPTSTSIGSINLQQIKQSLNQPDSSSTTLNQSSKSNSLSESLYNTNNKLEDNTHSSNTIDLNVLNNENSFAEKNTINSAENEWIIQALCEIENGFQIILDRVKQNSNSCKDAIAFLKKRAIIEEEYGKAMLKLCQGAMENNGKEKIETKQGTYNESWNQFIELHEKIGNNRIKFAEAIGNVTDNLFTLLKNTERSRKQLKEAGLKHQKAVTDSETLLEKAKVKYETSSEAWEEAILEKEKHFVEHYGNQNMQQMSGYNTITKKKVSLFSKNNTNPTKLQKVEDDARNKAAQANEAFKQQLISTNTTRREFFRKNLPKILRSLKETNDECDNTLQYNLGKYSLAYENALMSDATTISPLNEAQGLRKIVQKIDNSNDFIDYIRKPLYKGTKFEKNDIPFNEYKMQPETYAIIHPKSIFGIKLAEQLNRDNLEIPEILTKCANYIERYGINYVGIYRLSGSNSSVQKLRTLFDRDASQVTLTDENVQDTLINVTGVLKLYFRELPDSLFTQELYSEFIEASKIEDERRRLVEIHELVNRLPDPNYLTLRYLIAHLDRIQANQKVNKMGISNLSIIWGPTLFGGCNTSKSDGPENEQYIDMKYQCKVVEVILSNCYAIFDPDS
ncbi:RhoGAP-domain-containing protein [Neocallimastix californiae]|jgi:hypothetical protein|uniref:RhoGAP-domain-containing protein n=1 Tax=Neocallimastix californiae TaxID=1754190 RepID=A0A1Y2BYM7_9FUNG|nr:RhoGAP-domain-containing protein [Neocallimastix californiae]|eukprot:ORY39784.1 RhoGAP-domain-containing protein [Neocallimastix californiae]